MKNMSNQNDKKSGLNISFFLLLRIGSYCVGT